MIHINMSQDEFNAIFNTIDRVRGNEQATATNPGIDLETPWDRDSFDAYTNAKLALEVLWRADK